MRLSSRALRRAFIVCLLSCLALTYSAPQPTATHDRAQNQTASAQTGDDEITMTVTVSNKRGWPLGGLSKEAFTVTDDKTTREIASFSHEDAPHSIGVVLDMSGSVSGSGLTRHAMLFFDDFLKASNKANEYFIMAFATRPVIVVDWTTDINGILARLVAKSRGQTALYDSLYLAVEKVKTGRHKRRAVVVLTDGSDNSSKYTFSEVRELLRESDVMLYSVLMGQGSDPGSPLGEEAKTAVDELTSTSGGRAFYPSNKKEMQQAFDILAAEMRQQYRIGFKPQSVAGKPKLRSIKVKVTPPQNAPPEFRSLTVRSREGYYPDKRPR